MIRLLYRWHGQTVLIQFGAQVGCVAHVIAETAEKGSVKAAALFFGQIGITADVVHDQRRGGCQVAIGMAVKMQAQKVTVVLGAAPQEQVYKLRAEPFQIVGHISFGIRGQGKAAVQVGMGKDL